MTPTPMITTFAISVTGADHVTTVAVTGDVDMANGDQFHAVLAAELERRPDRLVVDLTGCTFFCSVGITALATVALRARDLGLAVVVVAHQPAVCRPLELTGADQLLRVVPTRDDATARV